MAAKSNFQVVPLVEVPKNDADFYTSNRRPVVLIVDDERVIADTLSIILKKNGFATLTVYDGKAALELAKAELPDLLISDVVMPGMSGIELAISLTQNVPECKILLFSGQAATVDLLAKAREMGHNFTTLAKPVHPKDMLRRISECLEVSDHIPDLEPAPHQHAYPLQ
ncbi:response regulator [Granulicella mallensis]|uniref:DNA-binding response OmpR family regulator n=1 Tax=Granulicella mallensis TaxID=940614 RepID=A0A7W7ZRU8_9BACT|nr:response regulator [Granulicella mallensis]MBB5064604.1 DNA-binding response OmpR family regulator [Granulicella mallensis]